MKYQVYSELLKPGLAIFLIKSAKETISKSGNNMFNLRLEVCDSDNNCLTVFDHLVDTQGMAWKIKHFCESVGIKYGDELVGFMLEGRRGKCIVETQKASGSYPEKTVIADYLSEENAKQYNPEDKFNDNIPF
jgi:hypothetical protein